jgi:preprotein translocase subunit SecE
MGLDGLLRATIVWPKRNENAKTITVIYFLIAIAAFTFLALGILLLIKFFQFH